MRLPHPRRRDRSRRRKALAPSPKRLRFLVDIRAGRRPRRHRDFAKRHIEPTGQRGSSEGRDESVSTNHWVQHRLVDIRRAVPRDAARIAEVHVRSWQGGYRGQLPQDLLDSLDPIQRLPRWTTILKQAAWPGRGTLVAEEGAYELLGFADLGPARGADQGTAAGEITSIYVLPDRWGQGIGHRLMAAGLATLTEAGYESATLWVLDSNVRAIRFYEAAGWHADGTVKHDDMDGTPIRELRYRHDLT